MAAKPSRRPTANTTKARKCYQEYQPLPDFHGRRPVVGSWIVNGFACGVGIREDSGPITRNTSRFLPHLFPDHTFRQASHGGSETERSIILSAGRPALGSHARRVSFRRNRSMAYPGIDSRQRPGRQSVPGSGFGGFRALGSEFVSGMGVRSHRKLPAVQLPPDRGQPLVAGNSVGTELLESSLFLAKEERSVGPQFPGRGRVDQGARIVGAHLEEDADLELTQRLAVEGPVQVIEAVAPDDRVDSDRRALAEDVDEELRRWGLPFSSP